MKIRDGFVSNSSSSSFIIGCEGPLTKEKIMKSMGVSKKSLFYQIANDLAECIFQNSKKYTKKEYMEEMCYEEDEIGSDAKKIFNSGMNFYCCEAANDSDDYIERVLGEVEIDYESVGLIIKKED